ncbi:hypothetical protein MED121_00940 [Marinomonas sp. MED121]|uniref:PilZ domain-containing protein n=1 Tax=Marinomonas sp. MED121 TaxID=314277 RepID=UPI000068FA04|nr:PilZ domain-containing protein [Marinomonas sp. MED121]EAQ64154.1 hypothetical protein MED121_00940 [Marinomonas sp. MED121]
MENVEEIGFTYESSNKRNAVRVDTHGYPLVFHIDSETRFNCTDLSFTGCSLADTPQYELDTLVKFVVTYKGKKVGALIGKMVYARPESTSWQFTKTQEKVQEFIEKFVLQVQKIELKKEAEKRRAEKEAEFLAQDDDDLEPK